MFRAQNELPDRIMNIYAAASCNLLSPMPDRPTSRAQSVGMWTAPASSLPTSLPTLYPVEKLKAERMTTKPAPTTQVKSVGLIKRSSPGCAVLERRFRFGPRSLDGLRFLASSPELVA